MCAILLRAAECNNSRAVILPASTPSRVLRYASHLICRHGAPRDVCGTSPLMGSRSPAKRSAKDNLLSDYLRAELSAPRIQAFIPV